MKKGKLIVIDGTDGSGKGTQTKLLVQRLKKHRATKDLDFPQYETFFGKLVASYLSNEFGLIHPKVASVLYAANRMEFRDQIKQWLKEGKVVVLNRYVSSNQIHQVARLDHRKEKQEMMKWISKMEYGIMGLPKPDLVVFLKVPAEVSYKLVEKKDPKTRKYIKGAKRDMLESDLEHQQRALKQVEELLHGEYRAAIVDCMKDGEIMSKAEVSEKVWEIVKKVI